MRPVRSTAIVACAGWLALTTGYAAAAADPQVDLGGTPVPGGSGSTDQANPTVLDPGLWTDELGDESSLYSTHYFRYERRMQGSTVRIGVIGASSDDYDGFDITAAGPDKTDCASASASPNSSSTPFATFGTAVTAGSDDPTSPCLTGPTVDFAIERNTSGSNDEDLLPIAIKVVEEAPVIGVETLPEPPDSPRFHRLDGVDGGADLDGGASFDDAPAVPVEDGRGDFSTSVSEGDEVLFRVPLGWDQGLSVEARAPKLDEKAYEDRGYYGADVSLQIIGPLRDSVTSAVSDVSTSGTYGDSAALDLSDALPPVAYGNRFADLPAAVPGDYWISLAVSPTPEDADALAVPLDVAVEVTGEAGDPPPYSGGVLAQGGGKFTGDYDPATPFLIGDGEFSAVASGSPLPAEDTESGWWGARRYAGLALVVAGAASAGAGLWRLRRVGRN